MTVTDTRDMVLVHRVFRREFVAVHSAGQQSQRLRELEKDANVDQLLRRYIANRAAEIGD